MQTLLKGVIEDVLIEISTKFKVELGDIGGTSFVYKPFAVGQRKVPAISPRSPGPGSHSPGSPPLSATS